MLLGAPRPGGWDRGRVGERLQAALAGLQELQVLREKQRELVRAALAMPQRPAAGEEEQPLSAHSKEHRLEATLSALKEQLSRLRRQDVGLKSHLDQLDQRISELKLDVSKTSSEYLDSDSRPSSGFYDLSDGGSCSLSNSCTSVYSESICSSHTSLLPSSQHPKARLSVFDYRPKSADESTVHTTSFQQQGTYVSDGCQITASRDVSAAPARSRPRPVSTGDLERLTPADARFQKETDPKSILPLCRNGDMHLLSVDPKFQNDLVSKNGIDVYPYPSPLHAVALQSPLFSLVGTSPELDFQAPPNKPMPSVTGPSLIRTRPTTEAKPGGYINKLLQLTRCKGNSQADASEWVPTKNQPAAMHQRLIITPSAGGVKINSSSSQLEKQESSLESNKAEGKLSREVSEGECAKQHETMRCVNEEQPFTRPDTEPSAVNSCYPAKSAARGSPLAEAMDSSIEHSSSYSQLCQEDSSPETWNAKAVPPRKLPLKRCDNAKSTSTGGHERMAGTEFVHAQFVPAESHQIRVKFASSKTKAVKIKRRNSEKVLRPGKQAFCMEKARGSHGATRLPAEWNQPQRPQGVKNLVRRPSYSGDVTGRSCSESSLFPVQVRLPTVSSRPELYGASASALHSLEAACVDTANKKKQRKWQSTVEISAKANLASVSHSFGLGAPRQPARRAGVLRTVSMRARSKNQRHGDYAKSESDHSEYSAECASLFHSTIAETSEGEVSDFTTNRFGDSESSESDLDGSSNSSSLALDYDEGDESELIWPEGSVRQSGTVQASSKPLPPVPKICRIKASKALKKKIRRFQPASLKVMTMV
ncbi:dapper homolog 2 [Chiroxiphia lanceolata]|uniref:dapper homolog 2 n=1 Tax=Chiroxiphia lanceolata TaxID=296741 RepID=UPI0013CEA6B3|nr:dapper homolog 2 [Chiroxiphia lanceolata]XP_032540099.1 dapper homolog 2 [Chiroxiphia lanceolata]